MMERSRRVQESLLFFAQWRIFFSSLRNVASGRDISCGYTESHDAGQDVGFDHAGADRVRTDALLVIFQGK